MSGWQRLFAVFSGAIVISAAGLWLISKPGESKYLIGCDSPIYVTPKEAATALAAKTYAQTSYSNYNCYESLEKVASGKAHLADMAKWHDDFEEGAIGISIFLAMIYALGAALGWVWRGFFPKKKAIA